MKKTHPTAQHCLTDAPGEQARVALFCAAEHGHVAGWGKHGSGGRLDIGPDQVCVIGAKLSPGDFLSGQLLNGCTDLGVKGLVAI